MNEVVYILGRQPKIGLAELESLYGADAVRPFGEHAALIDSTANKMDFARIGGSIKETRLITTLKTADWNKISDYLSNNITNLTDDLPEGKIRLGLSCYNILINPRRINATALAVKKTVKASGKSVRVIPNNERELNAAQVIHNQLTGPTGLELNCISNGRETLISKTVEVQDIDAYAARDQKRPMRDAKVGMLPPKLAQIIINLAIDDPSKLYSVLDPFCGTGVILQEAFLMGYGAVGTDLDPRMIEYSEANLQWLKKQKNIEANTPLAVGDAVSMTWEQSFDAIASETYLGRPFSAEPKPEVLRQVMQDVDTIHRKFLKNVARQTETGFRMCLAVPAWSTNNGFKHLKSLDSLEELGYTRQSFVHVANKDLVYHRKGQHVARELAVLIRN
jgi:tRNA G10  N-methylase Trm11